MKSNFTEYSSLRGNVIIYLSLLFIVIFWFILCIYEQIPALDPLGEIMSPDYSKFIQQWNFIISLIDKPSLTEHEIRVLRVWVDYMSSLNELTGEHKYLVSRLKQYLDQL